MQCFTLCDLKATQKNVQCSIIQELMLYKFELIHNVAEANKNICHAKHKETVNQSTSSRNFVWVVRTLMIRQGKVGLKAEILRLCSKPERQI